MNILKLKKQIETWASDIDKRYIQVKAQKDNEMKADINKRMEEGVSFDQAAVDILLQRAVVAETIVELAKDLWYRLDIK